MRPPDWAITAGERASLDEFFQEAAAAGTEITDRFLKLECWQTYREPEIHKSQEAFEAGDLDTAVELLTAEAEEDRLLYDAVRTKGLEFARVRMVKLPLTDYLEYEFLALRIRAEIGEHIEVVLVDSGTPLPSAEYFDYLVFDDHLALVHDYGTDGFQVGGWIVRERSVIQRLAEHITGIRAKAMSFHDFLAR